MTQVINIHSAPDGWENDPAHVYIGRANASYGVPASKWANPYSVDAAGSREAAIRGFRQYIEGRSSLLADLHELRGKTLVCWCAPKACHGDVLIDLIGDVAPLHVAIVGSRDYEPLSDVRRYVQSLPDNAVVVSGGAFGVDSAAEETANARGLATRIFPPDWKQHGKKAGYLRNADIIGAADIVVAFWDGKSSGTKHSMRLAEKQGKPLIVNPVRYESPTPQLTVPAQPGNVFDTSDSGGGRPAAPAPRYEWQPATPEQQQQGIVAYRLTHTHVWHEAGFWLPYTQETAYTERMLRHRYAHYLAGFTHGNDVPGWWLAWNRTQQWIEQFMYSTQEAAA